MKKLVDPLKKKKHKLRTGAVATDMEVNTAVILKRNREIEEEKVISSKKIKSKKLTIHALNQDNAAEAQRQPRCQK